MCEELETAEYESITYQKKRQDGSCKNKACI